MSLLRKAPFLSGWMAFNALGIGGVLVGVVLLGVLERLFSVHLSSNATLLGWIVAGLLWGYIAFNLAARITARLRQPLAGPVQSFRAALMNGAHLKAWIAFLVLPLFCLLPLAIPRTFPGLLPEIVGDTIEKFDVILDLVIGFFIYRFVLKNWYFRESGPQPVAV